MREATGETCADRIRFSLSDASGKLAFGAFEFVGGGACPEAEQRLREYLLGRPLADVDLRVVEKLSCAGGRECFVQIAAVIREHQEIFVGEND
jgi:hypothetical protein